MTYATVAEAEIVEIKKAIDWNPRPKKKNKANKILKNNN